jgi:RNA polymerase sigma factor (sigma-70 family)
VHDPTGLAVRRDGTPAQPAGTVLPFPARAPMTAGAEDVATAAPVRGRMDPVGRRAGEAGGTPLPRPLPGRVAAGVEEDALARRVGAGDEDAFAELCRRRSASMHALCRGILRNPDDAHDAVQNATEKALAALRRGQLRGDVRPWLTCICRNEALSMLRVRPPWTELDDHRAATGPSPETTILLRERLAGVAEDLADLPERQRLAIVLREVAELPYERVASHLGVRPDAARQAVREARVALREGDEGRDARCDGVRSLLADGDGRRRRSRRVRSHLRICGACRSWDVARGGRAVAVRGFLPGLWAALPGTWSWLPSFLVPGAGAGVGVGAAGVVGGSGVGAGGLLVGTGIVGGLQATAVAATLALGPTALPVPGATARGVDRASRTAAANGAVGARGTAGAGGSTGARSGTAGGGSGSVAAASAGSATSMLGAGAGRPAARRTTARGAGAGATTPGGSSTRGITIVTGTGRSPVTSGGDAAGRDARLRPPEDRVVARTTIAAHGNPGAGATMRGAGQAPGGGAGRDDRTLPTGPTASADRRGTAADAGARGTTAGEAESQDTTSPSRGARDGGTASGTAGTTSTARGATARGTTSGAAGTTSTARGVDGAAALPRSSPGEATAAGASGPSARPAAGSTTTTGSTTTARSATTAGSATADPDAATRRTADETGGA